MRAQGWGSMTAGAAPGTLTYTPLSHPPPYFSGGITSDLAKFFLSFSSKFVQQTGRNSTQPAQQARESSGNRAQTLRKQQQIKRPQAYVSSNRATEKQNQTPQQAQLTRKQRPCLGNRKCLILLVPESDDSEQSLHVRRMSLFINALQKQNA